MAPGGGGWTSLSLSFSSPSPDWLPVLRPSARPTSSVPLLLRRTGPARGGREGGGESEDDTIFFLFGADCLLSLSSAPSSPASSSSSTPTSVGCRASIGRRKKERPLPRRGPKTATATEATAATTTRRDEIVAPGPPPLLLRLHSLPLPLRVCACV